MYNLFYDQKTRERLYHQFAGMNPVYVFNCQEFNDLSIDEQMIVEDILA